MEGAERDFSVATKECVSEGGKVKAIRCVRLGPDMKEIAGSDFMLKADLVLLAMGFIHPVHEGMVKNLGVKLDQRGNLEANIKDYKTSIDKVFAAGDARRGQSLVVWAIREGRQAARAVDEYLMGSTVLPR
jgi:glutamate synthase (NADPH/NADH) small chain